MSTPRYPFREGTGPGDVPLPRARRAVLTDGPGMGAIVVDPGRAGHRTAPPDADLDSLDPPRRARWWSRVLAAGGGAGRCPTPDGAATAVVVEEAGAILALGLVGAVRPHPGAEGSAAAPDGTPDGVGEIWTFNVAPAAQGRGIGRALLAGVEEALRTEGFGEGVVWVVERNLQARRFFERAGWHLDGGEGGRRVAGREIRDLRYRRAL